MTRKKDGAKRVNWKEGMAGQEDFLRPLIQEVIQQVLEAEMDEALGAGKSERTAGAARLPVGPLQPDAVDAGGEAGVAGAAGPAGAVPDGGV